MDFIEYCDKNRILLAIFPPHSTHSLQPLDVVCFAPFAGSYTDELTCERSVGTVFQLPSPDAIYSRDEEKERKVGRHLMFVFAHGPRAAEAR
jgi:hypothetical protein